MRPPKIITSVCIFLVCSLVFSSINCKSRKGEHVQIFAEAKQIQSSLKKSGIITKDELQNQIDQIEIDGFNRWKISSKKNILIESLSSYRDYKNPSYNKKFIYEISKNFDILLLNR